MRAMLPTLRLHWAPAFATLLLASLLPLHPSHAQNAPLVEITGQVLDEQGAPLQTANVNTLDGKASALTDLEGNFRLKLRLTEQSALVFRYLGFRTDTLPLGPLRNRVANDRLTLPKPVVMAEEALMADVVDISANEAKRADRMPNSIERLSTKELDAQAASTLESSLEQTPGLTIYQNSVSIRGSSGFGYGTGSRVLLLMDGVPMMSGEAGDIRFEAIPMDYIQSIEVLKGAASVVYGPGAMGGVINVKTKTPTEVPETILRLRGELYDRPANDAIITPNALPGYEGAVHLTHARKIGQLELMAGMDLIRNSGWRAYEAATMLRARVHTRYHDRRIEGLSYGINVDFTYDSSGFFLGWRGYPDSALFPAFARGTDNQELDVVRGRNFYYMIDPKVTYLAPNGDQHRYHGRLFITDNQPENVAQRATAYQLQNQYTYVHRFSPMLNLAAGVQHTTSWIESDTIYRDIKAHALGTYAQLEATIGRLNLTAGARYQVEWMADDTSTNLFVNQPIFRLGGNMQLLQGTIARASIGQAVRNPSVRERYIQVQQGPFTVVPNPDIEVETGVSAELGLRQYVQLGSGSQKWQGFVDLAAFHMEFSNMVEFSAEIDTSGAAGVRVRNVNLSDASITGMEATIGLQGRIGNVVVGLNGSYTYINPIDRNGLEELDGDSLFALVLLDPSIEDRPRTLKYRSRHTLRLSGTVEYRKMSFTANCRYNSHLVNVDKQFLISYRDIIPYRADNDDGWTLVDVIVGRELTPKSQVSLHVFNVLNTEYMTTPGFLGKQRSFAVQYKHSF